MKIQLEIKDGKLIYSYAVGDSECGGSMNMNADIFTLFSKCLEMCIHCYSTSLKTRREKHEDKILKHYEDADS